MKNFHFAVLLLFVITLLTLPKCMADQNKSTTINTTIKESNYPDTDYSIYKKLGVITFYADSYDGTFTRNAAGKFRLTIGGSLHEELLYNLEKSSKRLVIISNKFQEFHFMYTTKGELMTAKQVMFAVPELKMEEKVIIYKQTEDRINRTKDTNNGERERTI